MIKRLKKWFDHVMMTPRERYLAAATDACDLEMRMKILQRMERNSVWYQYNG